MITAFLSSSYGARLLETISKWNVIVGFCILVVAMVCVFACVPIVQKFKCDDEKKGKIIMGCKIGGLLLAVVGALIACIL